MILNVAAGQLVSNFPSSFSSFEDRFRIWLLLLTHTLVEKLLAGCIKSAGHATGLTVQVLLVRSITNLILVIFVN